jgi:HD-like signal output (HDOD) protein
MPVDTASREQTVQAAIREISHVATLPEITVKIVKLVEDPKSTAQDLHTLIANDPALCARVLKVVNSAFYGLPGQIASINRAIVLLGLNAVKNIAIAASLAKLFKGTEITPSFNAKDLWSHSMAVAAASKMIADAIKLGLADEAFLAGLIHDIGIVVELQANRDKLVQVINRVCPKAGAPIAADMLSVEDEILGANHQDFGKGLCEKWKFPKSFAYVTGHHHNPLALPPECRTLASVVCVADHLAAALPGSFRLDLSSTDLPQDVLDDLKLSAAKCEELKAKLPSALETAAHIMS